MRVDRLAREGPRACLSCTCVCVQVLWVDRLTPEEFSNGFGSHTPMFSGQTKCVRYFMNCGRALRLFGSIVQEQGYVVNAENQHVHMSDKQLKAVAEVRAPHHLAQAC